MAEEDRVEPTLEAGAASSAGSSPSANETASPPPPKSNKKLFIVKNKNVWARFVFTASFLLISIPIYGIFQLDFRIISYLYLEPVIMNFVILLLLISVGVVRNKEISSSE